MENTGINSEDHDDENYNERQIEQKCTGDETISAEDQRQSSEVLSPNGFSPSISYQKNSAEMEPAKEESEPSRDELQEHEDLNSISLNPEETSFENQSSTQKTRKDSSEIQNRQRQMRDQVISRYSRVSVSKPAPKRCFCFSAGSSRDKTKTAARPKEDAYSLPSQISIEDEKSYISVQKEAYGLGIEKSAEQSCEHSCDVELQPSYDPIGISDARSPAKSDHNNLPDWREQYFGYGEEVMSTPAHHENEPDYDFERRKAEEAGDVDSPVVAESRELNLDEDAQTFEESVNNRLDRDENILSSNEEEVQSEPNQAEIEKSSSFEEVVEMIEFENDDDDDEHKSKVGMKPEKNGCDDPLTIEFIDMRPVQDKALYGFVPSVVLITFFLLVLYTTLFLLCAGLYQLIVIFKNTAFLLLICFVFPLLSVILAIVFYLKLSERRIKRNPTRASRATLIRDYKYDDENLGPRVNAEAYPSIETSRSRGSSEHFPRRSLPNPSDGDTFARQLGSLDEPTERDAAERQSLSGFRSNRFDGGDLMDARELETQSPSTKETPQARKRTAHARVSVSQKPSGGCFCFAKKTAAPKQPSVAKKRFEFSNSYNVHSPNQSIDYDRIAEIDESSLGGLTYEDAEPSLFELRSRSNQAQGADSRASARLSNDNEAMYGFDAEQSGNNVFEGFDAEQSENNVFEGFDAEEAARDEE